MDKSTPFTHPPEGYGAQKRIRDLINHAAKQKAEIERLQLELKYKLDQSERIKNLEAEIERLTDELINVEELAKDRYCKMQSEIERLRAALKQIEARGLDIINEHVGGSDASYVAQELTSMALAALEEADDE